MEVKDGTGIQATISGTASCPPPSTVEWDFCSAEQEQCSCSNSSQFVRFGAEKSGGDWMRSIDTELLMASMKALEHGSASVKEMGKCIPSFALV